MQFSIECGKLIKPLQYIQGVVNKRKMSPILNNVLLTTKGNKLCLTGTDREVELTSYATLLSATTAGEVTVSARKLFDICRSLPESSKLSLRLVDHKFHIVAGNSRFSLSTLPATEFPLAKEMGEEVNFTLNTIKLKKMIERTQFAMAQQDVRYYLNGCLWQIKQQELTNVATDGHRLAYCKISVPRDGDKNFANVIVPRKAIVEIMRILPETDEEVHLMIGTNHVRIVNNDFILISKVIDGRFPDYHHVIPRGGNNQLYIDRDTLKPVLSRIAILSNEKHRGVRLSLKKNELKVSANNPEHEEAEESIQVKYSGEIMEIGLNVNYLIDIINTLPKGKVLFTLSGPEKGVLIKHSNDTLEALNVIMPMRL